MNVAMVHPNDFEFATEEPAVHTLHDASYPVNRAGIATAALTS